MNPPPSRKLLSTITAILSVLAIITILAILTPAVLTQELVAGAIVVIGGLGGFHVAHQTSIDRRTNPPATTTRSYTPRDLQP
jgi:hypothetical protein